MVPAERKGGRGEARKGLRLVPNSADANQKKKRKRRGGRLEDRGREEERGEASAPARVFADVDHLGARVRLLHVVGEGHRVKLA